MRKTDYFSEEFWDWLKPMPIEIIQDQTVDELYLWYMINKSVQENKQEFEIDGFMYRVESIGQAVTVDKQENPIQDTEIAALENYLGIE